MHENLTFFVTLIVQKDCFEVYALVPGLLREEVIEEICAVSLCRKIYCYFLPFVFQKYHFPVRGLYLKCHLEWLVSWWKRKYWAWKSSMRCFPFVTGLKLLFLASWECVSVAYLHTAMLTFVDLLLNTSY